MADQWPGESFLVNLWLREQEKSVVCVECGKRQIWIGCKWRHLITVYTQTDQLWVGDDVDDDSVDDDDVDDDDGDHNAKVFATLVVMTKELCVFLLD